jgi:uncharacterized membrane protein YkoI
MKTRKAFLILTGVLAAGSTVYADKVTLSATPPSVQQVVRSKAGSHEIEDIDREQRNGQVTYEASWKNNAGVQQELLLNENGQILRDVQGDNVTYSTAPAGQWQPRFGSAETNYGLTDGQKIQFNNAPYEVQRTVNHIANGAAIESIYSGKWNGRTVFSSTFHRNGEKIRLQTFEDGSIVTKTPGVTVASSTAPKRQSFFDKATEFLGGNNSATQRATTPAMSLADAPQAVQQTVNQSTKGAPLQDLQRTQWNGRTLYEAAFQQNGQNMKLQVLDDGSILSMGPAATAVGAPASSEIGTGRR